jgi:hypothetical protein
MKRFLIPIIIFLPFFGIGQGKIEPAKLPLVPHSPHVAINGIHQRNAVNVRDLLKHGLQVVLDDNSFKVVQFDVIYDCHSRSLFDFSVKRYIGDKVEPGDDYLQKRVLAGDVIVIDNTIIEKNGIRFRMKDFGLIISK